MLNIKNLQQDISLAPHVSYRIGGPADYFAVVTTRHELVQAIVEARRNNMPYFVLGTGANILFGDKGFRGLVIKNESNNISIENNIVIADSGATVANLIEETAKQGLSGFEHFAGIPSTVGGAMWQNLHFLSPDRSETVFIESIVKSAEIIDEENNVLRVDKEFFKFGYDTSILHTRKLIVTGVQFELKHDDVDIIQKQAEENLKWRNERHPRLAEFPSCGSVFKKIEGIGAGRLIEKVGLKGHKIGGAQISEQHANFIVNTGNATAQDVLGLIKLVQGTVLRETGLVLETEIGLVGEFV